MSLHASLADPGAKRLESHDSNLTQIEHRLWCSDIEPQILWDDPEATLTP